MRQAIREGSAKLAGSQKIRFGVVGVINTIVDFVVLNLLAVLFGVPLFWSNVASTTTAMVTSFTLNRRAVFPGGAGSIRRQVMLFVVVTVIGAWVVQGGVLAIVHHALQSTGWNDMVIVTLAKIVGICAGLIWNYLLYSRLVFKKDAA